jgi:hypothetical protein
MSMGRMVRGKFLYWGEPLTSYHISIRKARRLLDRFLILGALIFGLGFLGLFAWLVYSRGLIETVFTKDFWLVGGDGHPAVLFWLGVVAFSFLVYRLLAVEKELMSVERYVYKAGREQPQVENENGLQTWREVFHLSRRKRIDISQAFTSDASQVLEEAYQTALKYNGENVTAWHVFYALLSAQKIGSVFIRLGIPVQVLQAKISAQFAKEKSTRVPLIGDDVQQILFQAYEKAYTDRQEFVQVTELLIATVQQTEDIQELLYDLNIDNNKLNNVVEWLRIREHLRRQYQKFSRAAARRNKYGLDRAMTAEATPNLNNFS